MKILLLTTMYPDPLRPGTEVCHYFAREWVKMGYEVLVVNYRSMFPRIYTDLARLFPKLAQMYVGNHVEMDRNMNTIQHEVEGIPVYSIPIFKYFPHGPYSKKELDKQIIQLKEILDRRSFVPDVIVGHFHNPQFQIVGSLKKLYYPKAKTCVSLHEWGVEPIKKCYGEKTEEVINGVDMIGFRSEPIKKRFEAAFGNQRKSFVCWSGTPQLYLTAPIKKEKEFTDDPIEHFLYVGQTIHRKFPKETLEAVHKLYGNDTFSFTFVGSKDIAFQEIKQYVNENDLNDRVYFTGRIPREEIINQYDNNQCFILISKNETFGLVYLEAMARGCIVIASRNEGMEGIVIDGVNGFMCNAGDEKDLISVLKRINALSKDEKMQISAAARNTASKLSDYNVAKNYIEAIVGD